MFDAAYAVVAVGDDIESLSSSLKLRDRGHRSRGQGRLQSRSRLRRDLISVFVTTASGRRSHPYAQTLVRFVFVAPNHHHPLRGDKARFPTPGSTQMSRRYAFATLVTSDHYLPGALTVAAGLKDVHPQPPVEPEQDYETVCIVTPETVDVNTIKHLRKAYDVVIGVEVIEQLNIANLRLLGEQYFLPPVLWRFFAPPVILSITLNCQFWDTCELSRLFRHFRAYNFFDLTRPAVKLVVQSHDCTSTLISLLWWSRFKSALLFRRPMSHSTHALSEMKHMTYMLTFHFRSP